MSPVSCLILFLARPWRLALPRFSGAGLLALMLSSCAALPWAAQEPLRPVARRRAVSASQRQEARMVRPAPQSNRPAVDYGPYKQIYLGMAIADVEALVGQLGQQPGSELSELRDGSTQPIVESEESQNLFWRWTHPSGVYNIHARLEPAPEPGAGLVVKAKWLTYNPPE